MIIMGPQGSGKSTYYEQLKNVYPSLKMVSVDSLIIASEEFQAIKALGDENATRECYISLWSSKTHDFGGQTDRLLKEYV